ncbi:Pimeloyl-ACP methyl ester carboxylesterase [Paenibacillus algorifonticola]|uniref:Pimeloyl-ACP methyl ester carboxylesterase n=1 Tax=Paenibacillus algorifonticola TaxID=684063 RepID=A0A1I2D5H1_9BACL|nr:alpha/beta hydrolase [Paenibacillus algorifonticola]SFE75313.1 Pimeloyl-ACP methyl ester carboxylesterase [Paenibacillus algorifonticola]
MKKWLRVLLKILAAIVIAIVVFIAIVFIVNKVSSKSEQGKIQTYGQLVPVDGKNMNVFIQGEGEETIVLLPGFGTAAPALDFKPLIDELSHSYKVVAIEPFGYGLSDGTDKERTTENIVSEIHEALQSLKIDRYILMGHSIAGIYGIDYANKYTSEVSAFVGIDSSVPTQPGMDAELPVTTFKLLKESGFLRLVVKVSGDPYDGLPYDEATKEQLTMLSLKNSNSPTTLNEMKNISSNFKAAEHLTFPKELPIIFFIQANNEEIATWIPLHEEQVKDSIHGKVMTFEGGHYLHHTKSKEIAQNFKAFMEEVK